MNDKQLAGGVENILQALSAFGVAYFALRDQTQRLPDVSPGGFTVFA